MAKRESTQHTIDRVRKPRVHITYDVETGGAMEVKELPFLVGVMADLSGATPIQDAEGRKIRVKDRKFVRIDRDNFNQVLEKTAPSLSFRVADKLSGQDGGEFAVALAFKSMDDFEPEQVVRKLEPLRKLLDARQRLSELKSKIDNNDRLEELLNSVLASPGEATKLKDAIGTVAPAAAAEEEPSHE